MSNVLVSETSLTNIANSIRTKLGSSDTYRPGDMSSAIDSIPSGGSDTEFIKMIERPANSSITLPSGTTSIGNYAFYSAPFTGIDMSQTSLTNIAGTNAFGYCRSLTSIYWPTGITQISGNSAFSRCSSLAITSLPDSITSIGYQAFYECTSLALTHLPQNISTVGDSAFAQCTGIKFTYLNVQKISNGMCSGCTGLTTLTFGTGVKYIDPQAFNYCTGLTSVTFQGTPTTILNCFVGCSNLTTINVPWSQGAVANAPWGATNATVNYDYVPPSS